MRTSNSYHSTEKKQPGGDEVMTVDRSINQGIEEDRVKLQDHSAVLQRERELPIERLSRVGEHWQWNPERTPTPLDRRREFQRRRRLLASLGCCGRIGEGERFPPAQAKVHEPHRRRRWRRSCSSRAPCQSAGLDRGGYRAQWLNQGAAGAIAEEP